MNPLTVNVEEANRALTEKPIFATSAERVLILNELKSQYKELPQQLRFAKVFSLFLSRVSTPLEEYDLIAGRCVDRELTAEEEEIFQAYVKHPDYPERELILPSGHCTFSWKELANEGLVGLRNRAEKTLAETDDEHKRNFLQGAISIYDAISAYMLRYADCAKEKGMHELAEHLTQAATEKPNSFAVALQLLSIVAFLNCAYITKNPTLTLGRLDQILFPFFEKDVKEGALTEDQARALITDYYCKHNLTMGRGEHQLGDEQNSTTFDRIHNFDSPQYLLLAGTDEEGNPAVNRLTQLFAECIQPTFKNPVIVVRYFKNMNVLFPELWKVLTEKALGSASLMFYNDTHVLKTLERMGVPQEDRVKYEHFGCNWPSLGDISGWMEFGRGWYNRAIDKNTKFAIPYAFFRANSPHSWPEDFVEVLKTLSQREEQNVSIEAFYDTYFARFDDFLDRKLDLLSQELAARQTSPSLCLTYTDCFLWDSLCKGECYAATAKYHFELQPIAMFGTIVDCFTAVDQLVFQQKKLTLKQLVQAIECDFDGMQDVLALCRNAEKFGSDGALSNGHAHRIITRACASVIEKNKPYLAKQKLFLVPCLQSDTWHIKYGETYGATPDGRRAFTPFSQNANPTHGSCKNGLTGMFNSLLQIPEGSLLSGALNLDIDANDFAGEENQALFSALLATYFNRGGLHAQISCTSAETLRNAQKNPHAYRDLRVRITGYSGVFVDVCERLQNDIIKRFE